MNHESDIIPLGGFAVQSTTGEALARELKEKMDHQQTTLLFANTNFIVKCQSFKPALTNGNTIIVNDGIGMDIATMLIHQKKFRENLNGTDFIPFFLKTLGEDVKVFMLGAKPGIAKRAADQLRSMRINVVGYRNGYEEARDAQLVVEDINKSGATVLLVAMGNPNQEQWIIQHRDQLKVRTLIGVGALLDFLAGDKPRAPKIVQRLRLEWLYRLCLEPSRLLRRYTLDIAVFLQLCLRQGKSLQ